MSTLISSLFALFVTLSASLPGRILATLGIGVLTFASMSTAASVVVSTTMSSWGSLPASAYQVASMAGMTDALGITCAAVVARVSMSSLSRFGRLPT